MKKRILIFFLAGLSAFFTGCDRNYQPAPPLSSTKTVQPNGTIQKYEKWFARDFSPEQRLLNDIRKSIIDGTELKTAYHLNVNFNPDYSTTAITLFQPEIENLRWISKKDTLDQTLNRIIHLLRTDERFTEFAVADAGRCRIMLEVIDSEKPFKIEDITTSQISPDRFEPGITGFKLIYDNNVYFYMPTDAVINSHLYLSQVFNHLSKKTGAAQKTNSISERDKLMRSLSIKWYAVTSNAFITYGDKVLPLYRGYPVPVEFSQDNIYDMMHNSIQWILDNAKPDGQFLYYYDGILDTVIDHVHPSRDIDNNYYNILRHSGGIIALLRMYELQPDNSYIETAQLALDFLTKQIRTHEYEGRTASYVFYNKKAKLGGSGIALVAFLKYRQLTGSTQYDSAITGLANHILSRIDDNGEMIGYYIHPLYNDGNPIIDPNEQIKRMLFSFYYPGEALLGLALYEKNMPIDEYRREEIRSSAQKALDFLVNIRPEKYAEMFEPLPSDGWLMQAIEEWADIQQFQKPQYLNFVFDDAKAMIANMYNSTNSPYYDYPGTFYYNYGDHAYPDGARAEGLISAYYLARKMKNEKLADTILENCRLVAKSLTYTYNSPQSTYMYPKPQKAIGTFRFKLTRHWMRVDTVQHTSCFYIRLLQALQDSQ
ncbi:MAG: protein containing Six-hairpin glycosidase-like domain protein [Phycisphaerae bacterium]|nr:protein containing Six-hairpin glycosidase-like domain protein [Phycisphaerae bacterium]